MPRSPMPARDGLNWRWMRTRDADQPAVWQTLYAYLASRLPAEFNLAHRFAQGDIVDEQGRPINVDAPYQPNRLVWFPGPEPTDAPPAEPLRILYADQRIVVIDKPHFQATTPQGAHARNTALVQLRTEGGYPEAAPAHRLDRLTAGVLAFTTGPRWRRQYQDLFAEQLTDKTYDALGQHQPALTEPTVRRSHIIKDRSSLQAREIPNAPVNAVTTVHIVEHRGGIARYKLTPTTGRTHQLRVHLSALGAAILHDPLYPVILDVDAQPTQPMQLIARRLSFVDPIDHTPREFVSQRSLHWPVPD